MTEGQNKNRGRWVFRNQRWQYIRPEHAEGGKPNLNMDNAAILRLVDIVDLVGTMRVGQQLFALPFCVSVNARAGEAAPGVRLAFGDLEWPTWWPDLEVLVPGISERLKEQVAAGAQAAAAAARPLASPSFWGPKTLYSVPAILNTDSNAMVVAVLTLVIGVRESEVTPAELERNLDLPGGDFEGAAGMLNRHSRDSNLVRHYRALMEAHIRTHEARLRAAYEARIELASEQARGRQLLLRAENLERQLLRNEAEIERVQDSAGVPMRQLAAILDNPRMGVTIEDVNYRVRYQNPMLRRAFGNQTGRFCYEVYKGRKSPCDPCPIVDIWQKGEDSVRYTTVDPRSGRSFEVFAFPLVGEKGDKLIVEVGVEVTDLIREQKRLELALAAVTERKETLRTLVAELNQVLSGTCRTVSKLVNDSGQIASSDLAEPVAETRRLTAAMGLPDGSGPADVPLALARVADRLKAGGLTVPAIRVSVMPDVPISEPHLDALLEALLRFLHKQDLVAERHSVWDLTHTMSGSALGVSKGENFHVLTLGPKRASAEFSSDDVSSVPTIPGVAESIDFEPENNLALASLLVRKLGGRFWRQSQGGMPDTFFLSLPGKPPD